MGREEIVQLVDEPALHLVHILQAALLAQLLYARAGLPLVLLGLVAADMDVF